jgi:hypothetical protein
LTQRRFSDDPLRNDDTIRGLYHWYTIRVLLEQVEIQVDVGELDVDLAKDRFGHSDARVAQRAIPTRVDHDLHDALNDYLSWVRPVTSIAVAVLLGIILLAFVFKLATGGLTP